MKLDEILGAFNGKNRKKAARNTATGLGLGVALGAIAGLLFAPKSGKETRQDIKVAAEKAAQVVKEAAEKGAEVVKEKAHEASEFAKEKAQVATEFAKEKLGKKKAAATGEAGEVAEECEDENVESAEF